MCQCHFTEREQFFASLDNEALQNGSILKVKVYSKPSRFFPLNRKCIVHLLRVDTH